MTSKSLLPGVASVWRTPAVNRFRNEVDDLFESFFSSPAIDVFDTMQINTSRSTFPKVNVSETDEDYTVDIAVAGFDKDDVNLELKDNTLFINAKKKEEKDSKKYLRREISFRSFSRMIRFPDTVTSEVTASYKDGLINVNIKKEIKKPEESGGIKINIG